MIFLQKNVGLTLKTALLISTYNWPEALNLVLLSVQKQSILPDEILIADDGSLKKTKDVIDQFKKSTKLTVHHEWQEDKGFRKAAILNKTLAHSSSDYIIQIDGDCILHKHFIKDHIRHRLRNHFLYGSRVNITKNYLPLLFKNEQIKFNILSKGIKKRTRSLRIPYLSLLYRSTNQLSKKIRGCNFSFFKSDMLEINGFNEDFEGWGKEDSEFAVRLLNKGCKGKRIRYNGILYHIWHIEKPKNRTHHNKNIEQTIANNKTVRCTNGIDKYLNGRKNN